MFAVAVGLTTVIGYQAFQEDGWFTQSPKLAEPPKVTEGVNNGANQQEGKVEGEVPDKSGETETNKGNETTTGGDQTEKNEGKETSKPDKPSDKGSSNSGDSAGISKGEDGVVGVVAEPENVTALVNPFNKLPDDYTPADLVYPDVRFIFSEKIEKRMMRKEAAEALEKLFSGSEEDGIYLAGVSAYRSHATQVKLFDRYVKRDGYEKARTYSALPGTSEHETGLAVDVTSSDGKCAAADCFGDTKESDWLKKNAANYGFIIRYPEGKDKITGYQYEPWHLRYVGTDIAAELAASGETLEEYYDAVPVNK
ncbi:M15 family metallopeptidase [Paenibacillus sp. GSMTC-2017]|nr:M15 family metallopeptidase [Paenibacillus sp. GSMTC-2017]